jgi:hypothetical protein
MQQLPRKASGQPPRGSEIEFVRSDFDEPRQCDPAVHRAHKIVHVPHVLSIRKVTEQVTARVTPHPKQARRHAQHQRQRREHVEDVPPDPPHAAHCTTRGGCAFGWGVHVRSTKCGRGRRHPIRPQAVPSAPPAPSPPSSGFPIRSPRSGGEGEEGGRWVGEPEGAGGGKLGVPMVLASRPLGFAAAARDGSARTFASQIMPTQAWSMPHDPLHAFTFVGIVPHSGQRSGVARKSDPHSGPQSTADPTRLAGGFGGGAGFPRIEWLVHLGSREARATPLRHACVGRESWFRCTDNSARTSDKARPPGTHTGGAPTRGSQSIPKRRFP